MRRIFTIMALTFTILTCLSFTGAVSIHTPADSRTLATQQCSSTLIGSVTYGGTVSVGLYQRSGCGTSYVGASRASAGPFFIDFVVGSSVASKQSSSSTDTAAGAVADSGNHYSDGNMKCCGGYNPVPVGHA